MKALVTGGAGFAGSHLTEWLLGLGWETTVLAAEQEDLGNIRHLLGDVRLLRGDLRDAEGIANRVRGCAPDRVFHLAALSSPSESMRNPALTYEVNFLGTLNLLLACRQLGRDLRFLFVSSSEVYGEVGASALPLREEMPLRPANPYAASKAAGEMLAYQFFKSEGMAIVRVRPFNHTGPRQASTFVCSDFARQIAEIELGLRPPRITVGNLKVKRDFSDVRDIIRGYHLLLEKGVPGEVYQLGAGRALPIEEILQTLLRTTSASVEVVVDPARLRPSESPSVWGDTSKAESSVGWKREFSLGQALQDLKQDWVERLSAAPMK